MLAQFIIDYFVSYENSLASIIKCKMILPKSLYEGIDIPSYRLFDFNGFGAKANMDCKANLC